VSAYLRVVAVSRGGSTQSTTSTFSFRRVSHTPLLAPSSSGILSLNHLEKRSNRRSTTVTPPNQG